MRAITRGVLFGTRVGGGRVTIPSPPPSPGQLPNDDHGPRFNDWVHAKTSGAGGDYPSGDVWMPGGTYYLDPFDMSAGGGYARSFDPNKPYNNWFRFREFDGPGTVTFDLRPESAAAALGQTQTQAYNDTLHGGGFTSIFDTGAGPTKTAGSARWCFDGGFLFQDGAIHTAGPSFGAVGFDRLIFYGSTHRFTGAEWRRQFDIIRAIMGIGDPGPDIPDTTTYRNVWNNYRFHQNNINTEFRMEGVSKLYVIRADIAQSDDDGTFFGAGTQDAWIIGSVISEIGTLLGSGMPGAWTHPDVMQVTGSFTRGGILDSTINGHMNIAGEVGDTNNFVADRVWEGNCGIVGGVAYQLNGHTLNSTNKFGSGAPTTRLSGHFYKGFSNGVDHNDTAAAAGFQGDLSLGDNGWHYVMVHYPEDSASFSNFSVAVPAGVTVDPTTKFMTSSLSSFLDSGDVPHQQFRAAYSTSDLVAAMSDYGISFD